MTSKDNKLTKDIGIKIKTFRKLKGISVEQLAKNTNMAEGTIRNIESGSTASFPLYYEIANELSVPFSALLPDYATHASGINSTDMQIFIEAYKSSSETKREVLMDIIKSFMVKNHTNPS